MNNLRTLLRVIFICTALIVVGNYFLLESSMKKESILIHSLLFLVSLVLAIATYLHSESSMEVRKKRQNDIIDGQSKIIEKIKNGDEEINAIREYYKSKLNKSNQQIGIAENKINELLNQIKKEDISSNNIKNKVLRLFAEKKVDLAIDSLDEYIGKRNEVEMAELYKLKGDFLITQLKIPEALKSYKKSAIMGDSIHHKINYAYALKNFNYLSLSDETIDEAIKEFNLNPILNDDIIIDRVLIASALGNCQ